MNGGASRRLNYWANYLFFLVPVLAAAYIALVLVPAATARWPARFISWQALSLLALVLVFSFASARPLYLLRHDMMGARDGMNGVAAVLSLFAIVGGTVAILLHSSPWVVGAFLASASLPPLVRGLSGAHQEEPGRRFNM